MKLSELLQRLPNEQRYSLYRKIKAAIRDGTLSAVPLTTPLQIPRTNKPLPVLDHYIITNQAVLDQWLFEATRPVGKRATGAAKYAIEDPSKLTAEELQKKADEYRASLSKPKPKKKPKAG